MEAQRFPDDYQGILAGAPGRADESVRRGSLQYTRKSPYVHPRQQNTGDQRRCAGRLRCSDGVTDGIINDPRQCHFDPSVLRCREPSPKLV